MESKSDILKVREYLGIVVEIKADDPAVTQREIVQSIFKIPGVTAIKYLNLPVSRLKGDIGKANTSL
ncbi:MAG TPA: hypothetical protein ENI53_00910 [Thermoplasmatales archaeon]|nr:hypothetical protein [Thermoplasmatales archaeon]